MAKFGNIVVFLLFSVSPFLASSQDCSKAPDDCQTELHNGKVNGNMEPFFQRCNGDTSFGQRCQLCCRRKTTECPTDFVENDGKCYGSPSKYATWSQAVRHCCKIGDSYNLLVIEDENEYEFVKDKIQAHFGHNGRSLWIGLKETASRRTFEWVDGSSLSYGSTFYRYPWAVYSHWDKEPNSLGGSSRQCVRLDQNVRWADTSCNNRYRFICEGTSTETTTSTTTTLTSTSTSTSTTTTPTTSTTTTSTSTTTTTQPTTTTEDATIKELMEKIDNLTKRVEDLEACCTAHNKSIEENKKRHENVDLSFNKLCPLIDEIFDVANPPGSTKYDCCHEFYSGTPGQIGNAFLCTSESFLTLSGIYPTSPTGTCASTCGALPPNLVDGMEAALPGGN